MSLLPEIADGSLFPVTCDQSCPVISLNRSGITLPLQVRSEIVNFRENYAFPVGSFPLLLTNCPLNNKNNMDLKNTLAIAGTTVGVTLFTVGVAPFLFGFGTIGVTAGTIAAATQASIGNVAANSLFAYTTSFVMSGAATKCVIGGGATAVGFSIPGLLQKCPPSPPPIEKVRKKHGSGRKKVWRYWIFRLTQKHVINRYIKKSMKSTTVQLVFVCLLWSDHEL